MGGLTAVVLEDVFSGYGWGNWEGPYELFASAVEFEAG